MTKKVIHISDAEAASDFASLLDRVRKGAEIVIEHDARPVAVMRPAEPYVRLAIGISPPGQRARLDSHTRRRLRPRLGRGH